MDLEKTINSIPDSPGVYMMLDENKRVIYVGKAKSLKKRVRSYFRESIKEAKTQVMVSHIADIDYIITHSPMEALILECNLIKKHRPRYNIMLKDDKSYPYIKVTLNERFPRVIFTREVKKDGAKYFGPYTDTGAVRELLNILKKVYPFRMCSKNLDNVPLKERPCLNHHINRCMAPCSGNIKHDEYIAMIKEVMSFLSGRGESFIKLLDSMMIEASLKMNYEIAAQFRDSICSAQKLLEKQKIVSGDFADRDVIAMARGEGVACVQIFYIRNGKLLGSSYNIVPDKHQAPRAEILTSFLKLFYSPGKDIPGEILVEDIDFDEKADIEELLGQLKGRNVKILVPKRGEKAKLVQLAGENALISLAKDENKKRFYDNGLEELQRVLNLPRLPKRIECFDISNIQGRESVASMVVFEKGKPLKSHYRKFKIKTVSGPNDFASINEVIARRFKNLKSTQDISFSSPPDLIIIDGGKGQLNAALKAAKGFSLDIPMVGLAKEFEHIFVEGKGNPIILPEGSLALKILTQLRDEAHRFALTFHRNLRSKGILKSVLDDIPYIGKSRKEILLKEFATIEDIKKAPREVLESINGLDKRAVDSIIDFFNSQT